MQLHNSAQKEKEIHWRPGDLQSRSSILKRNSATPWQNKLKCRNCEGRVLPRLQNTCQYIHDYNANVYVYVSVSLLMVNVSE